MQPGGRDTLAGDSWDWHSGVLTPKPLRHQARPPPLLLRNLQPRQHGTRNPPIHHSATELVQPGSGSPLAWKPPVPTQGRRHQQGSEHTSPSPGLPLNSDSALCWLGYQADVHRGGFPGRLRRKALKRPPHMKGNVLPAVKPSDEVHVAQEGDPRLHSSHGVFL